MFVAAIRTVGDVVARHLVRDTAAVPAGAAERCPISARRRVLAARTVETWSSNGQGRNLGQWGGIAQGSVETWSSNGQG